jgi:hypothetical protein
VEFYKIGGKSMFEGFQGLESLDQLLTKIADSLGMGVDVIRENGMEYIMMYGQYEFLKSLWWIILGNLLLFIVGYAIVAALYYIYREENYEPLYKRWSHYGYLETYESEAQKEATKKNRDDKNDKHQVKYKKTTAKILKYMALGTLFGYVLMFIISILPYLLSPEIYSIKQALELIQ